MKEEKATKPKSDKDNKTKREPSVLEEITQNDTT